MSKYADNLIVEWKHAPLLHHIQNLTFTPTGYGDKIPTEHMVRIRNKWHRVFYRIYSNFGSRYVILNDERYWITSCYSQNGLTKRGEVEKEIAGFYANSLAFLTYPGWHEWTTKAYRLIEIQVADMLDKLSSESYSIACC